ncbi:MAG: hypothetical protein J7551_12385 [Chloroflexi bacterium]|nr:hypothetical protein [Chloroflexota bacterium]
MNRRPSNVLKALRKVLKHRNELEKVARSGQVLLLDSYKNAQRIVELVGMQDAVRVVERLMHAETNAYHILRREGTEQRYIAPDPLNALHLTNDPFGEALTGSTIVYERQAFLPYPIWMDWLGVAIFGPVHSKQVLIKYARITKWLYLNGETYLSDITQNNVRLVDICHRLQYPLNRLAQRGMVFQHRLLNDTHWIVTAYEGDARDEAALELCATDAPMLRSGQWRLREGYDWSDMSEVRKWLPEQARRALISTLQRTDMARISCSREQDEYADHVWTPPLAGMDAAPIIHEEFGDDENDCEPPAVF